MISSFCSWCSWTKQEGWVNWDFIYWILELIRWSLKGRWVQDFLLSLRGFESFLLHILRVRLRSLVCVYYLQMIKSMLVGFCFIGAWCYSEWWRWDFVTLAQLQGSEMFPCLFQYFMDGCINLKVLPISGLTYCNGYDDASMNHIIS